MALGKTYVITYFFVLAQQNCTDASCASINYNLQSKTSQADNTPPAPSPPTFRRLAAAPSPANVSTLFLTYFYVAIMLAMSAATVLAVFCPFSRIYILAVAGIWGWVVLAVNLTHRVGSCAECGQRPVYSGVGLLFALSGLALMSALSQF